MQPALPLPLLAETCTRYLNLIRPLLDDEHYLKSQAIVENFVHNEGQTLQEELQKYADKQSESSWLIDWWHEAYLSNQAPLPLSSNVGFAVYLNIPDSGSLRIARLIQAYGALCAQYLNDTLPENISARGEKLDMLQWKILQGAARIPGTDGDTYHFDEKSAKPRYAIIWYRQQGYILPVLDEQHRPYSLNAFQAALVQLIEHRQKITADDNICAFSLIERDASQLFRQGLLENKHNQQLVAVIENSLFHLKIEDQFPEDATQALANSTFLPQADVWAYKPITLIANLHNNDLYTHIEHTWLDAGALMAIMARVEALAENLPETSEAPIQAKPLNWQLNVRQQSVLQALSVHYQCLSVSFKTDKLTVVSDEDSLPPKVSKDFLMQIMLQYARLKSGKPICNTYEAVDVSHFRAGRTECVRPVSEQSVAFARALLQDNADETLFQAALNEHKNRIKDCKRGHGAQRHLFGLQKVAEYRGLKPAIFADKAYQISTTDIFSTSSMGIRSILGEFAFAPTAKNGLGICYLWLAEEGFTYIVSYEDSEENKAQVSALAQDLQEALEKIKILFIRN